MRYSTRRGLAVGTLLVLVSSSACGWAVALHLASDDDHHLGSSRGVLAGLGMVLHGHSHDEGTPAHEHPLVASVAASLPGSLLLLTAAMVGDAPEVVAAAAAPCRQVSPSGPTHDPPPRSAFPSVLRI